MRKRHVNKMAKRIFFSYKHLHSIRQKETENIRMHCTHTCNIRFTGPSLAVYGNSPVPHSRRARPRLQISAG